MLLEFGEPDSGAHRGPVREEESYLIPAIPHEPGSALRHASVEANPFDKHSQIASFPC